MKMKSQHPDYNQSEIYQWIEILQNNPKDEAIQEKVVHRYEDLVASIARKYALNNSLNEDLVQVGMIGLFAAVRRYDKTYGKSFESFAVPTIIGEMKRYLRDKTWSVHVPRRIKELGPRIKRAVDELTRENQNSPSITEIANYLDVSEEHVLETMEMGRSYKALSVDKKIEADSEGSTVAIIDIVGSEEEGYQQIDQRMLLEKILPILSEREQMILQYMYFENKSQKETGELLGISQMHVSRLMRQALLRLREAIRSEKYDILD